MSSLAGGESVWGGEGDHRLGGMRLGPQRSPPGAKSGWGRGDCQLPAIGLGANQVRARDGKKIEEEKAVRLTGGLRMVVADQWVHV